MDTSSTTEAILYGPITDFGVYYILQYLLILYVDSEGPDQNVYMCSLIWAFAVRICPAGTFSHGTAQIFLICSLARVFAAVHALSNVNS